MRVRAKSSVVMQLRWVRSQRLLQSGLIAACADGVAAITRYSTMVAVAMF